MPNPNVFTMIEEFDVIEDSIARAASEGAVVPVDPDVADFMGAMEEPALSEQDALNSRFDDVVEGDE